MRIKETVIYNLIKKIVLVDFSNFLISLKRDNELNREIYKVNRFYKISFCTVCMGRTHHLAKTYLKNIEDNKDYPNIEFVLLNYNSNDNMDGWVRQNLYEYIESGIVKYYKTFEPSVFHASKAKNLAHRIASGDVLVNLDADNFTGRDNAFYLNHLYVNSPSKILVHFSSYNWKFYDTIGRIAIKKEDFLALNGYREDFGPMKMQDIDLLKRCKLANIKTVRVELINFLRTIKHDDKDRKINIQSNLRSIELQSNNQKLMNFGLENGISKANPDGFNNFKVFKNFERELIELD